MLASVLFTTLALFGSAVLAAPTIPANTTAVQCRTTMMYDEFLASETYFKAHSNSAPELDTAAVIVLNIYYHIISQDSMSLIHIASRSCIDVLDRHCRRWPDPN
jgi:hypothetical protein